MVGSTCIQYMTINIYIYIYEIKIIKNACFFQKTEVNMLLFIADNLACFPYQSQEEPLFIMHHIDITLSVSGSNLLQTFREVQKEL